MQGEETMETLISRAAAMISQAQHVVALTGAGISRPSGIPDFRSPDGLWSNDNPMEVASLYTFLRNPGRFYAWMRGLIEPITSALPNTAHLALAELEHAGYLRAIITQNIDGLHQHAGSREVFELHGHLRSATCIQCERQVPSAPLLEEVRHNKIPRCTCGGTYKPDVVLFDEALPRGIFWLAQRALEYCDVLLVVGTSLEVYPVSDMPHTALRNGARLIIINLAETHLDVEADIVLHADVAQVLPAIVQQVTA